MQARRGESSAGYAGLRIQASGLFKPVGTDGAKGLHSHLNAGTDSKRPVSGWAFPVALLFESTASSSAAPEAVEQSFMGM